MISGLYIGVIPLRQMRAARKEAKRARRERAIGDCQSPLYSILVVTKALNQGKMRARGMIWAPHSKNLSQGPVSCLDRPDLST